MPPGWKEAGIEAVQPMEKYHLCQVKSSKLNTGLFLNLDILELSNYPNKYSFTGGLLKTIMNFYFIC